MSGQRHVQFGLVSLRVYLLRLLLLFVMEDRTTDIGAAGCASCHSRSHRSHPACVSPTPLRSHLPQGLQVRFRWYLECLRRPCSMATLIPSLPDLATPSRPSNCSEDARQIMDAPDALRTTIINRSSLCANLSRSPPSSFARGIFIKSQSESKSWLGVEIYPSHL